MAKLSTKLVKRKRGKLIEKSSTQAKLTRKLILEQVTISNSLSFLLFLHFVQEVELISIGLRYDIDIT